MITEQQFNQMCYECHHASASEAAARGQPLIAHSMEWWWGPDMIKRYVGDLIDRTGGLVGIHGIHNLVYLGARVRVMRQDGCAIKLLQKF